MTRDEKFKEILSKALLIFPVFKGGSKPEDKSTPRLSYLQFTSLMFIVYSPKPNGEPMNVIASFLGISKQQTTKLIDSLSDQGLVERSWNPESRREILITASANGKKMLEELREERVNEFIHRLSILTDDEVDELHKIVTRSYELLAKAKY